MIKSLHISNFALINTIDIDFADGFNIITGETGAGKSIILGALSLLLGGRADLKSVRDKSKKTIIEAVFEGEAIARINDILTVEDIDAEENSCILRREITTHGGSRAFINDTPVNLQQLNAVAIELIDIHSQHQNLLLAKADYQLYIIDSLADTAGLLDEYSKVYTDYRHALKAYVETRDMINRNRSEAEYISYQLEQLDQMNLKPGEQNELENDRNILANVSGIKMKLTAAISSLNPDGTSVSEALSRAANDLSSLGDVYSDATDLASRLESAKLEVQDIMDTLSDYDSRLAADPATLEEIEMRLGEIYSLETKHHVDSVEALIELREQMRAQLDAISNSDETLAELERQAKSKKKAAVIIAREISEKRKTAAASFAASLKERAMPLGMSNIRCEISFVQSKLGPKGMDNVEFLFAFNKNQPLMPVGKTASGGEISRVILAIKSIVAEKMNLPTIIFDEVDTGVSGDIANKMGALMSDISQRVQVITITHLPQVAALGRRHFKVYKEDDEFATHTFIKCLGSEERVGELALMLSGSFDDPNAIVTARALLERARIS
jgi:DNA repair protein RecN (Recombination protein N)